MPAPTNDALIVPKVIGERLGISAKRVNLLLEGGGYQESYREADGALKWRPTEKGRAAGGRMMDTDRGNGTGAAQQLKWPFAIVEAVRGLLEARA